MVMVNELKEKNFSNIIIFNDKNNEECKENVKVDLA